jgi:geranylgeranyl diphosphate synthase type I
VAEPFTDEPSGKNPISEGFRDHIDQIVDAVLAEQHEQLAALGSDLDPLFDAAERALNGGKRLRAGFAYWGWRAAGGSTSKTAALMRVAASIELVHASALVHDDVLDSSQIRRGGPAAQRVFAALRRDNVEAANADRFGTNAAILLGDLLLGWSDELFATSGFKPKAILRGRRYFDRLRSEVVAGQYLDILSQTRPHSSAADSMRVVRYKSAKYTVERPLQLGAALGKAGPELLTALSAYGIPLGEAFQLRDDVLGVFGEPAVTGKPAGDDIREGKRTLLLARALDKANPTQRRLLEREVGNPELNETGLAAVRETLRETGAVRAVETVITELASAAVVALTNAPLQDPEADLALRTLSRQATNRSS